MVLPPGWYIIAWGRAEMKHVRSRAGAEQGTKEAFRQEFLLSQRVCIVLSFILRRSKVTIKPQLTPGIWTSLP